MIRLPDFVTEQDFAWAVQEAAAKKNADLSKAEYLTYEEGRCVQCMHISTIRHRTGNRQADARIYGQPGLSPGY